MPDILPIDRPFETPLDYLIVSAHPDDAELGVGGTILSLKASGARVGILDLTSGEPTPHGRLEIRARETAAATQILGLDWRGNLGLTNRSLVADLDSRRKLASIEQAQYAAQLLTTGRSIADVITAAGYYDQPQLARAMRWAIGHTPGELGSGVPFLAF